MRILFFLLFSTAVVVASPTKYTLCDGIQTPNDQQFEASSDTQTTLFDAVECAPSDWPLPMRTDNANFVPLGDFLDQVKKARYNHYKHGGVRSARAFEEMRDHILTMYGGVSKFNTQSFFLDVEHVDCIDMKEQPSVRIPNLDIIENAPPITPVPQTGDQGEFRNSSRFQNVISPLKLGLVDSFGNTISCPKGTIPFSRITLETLTKFPTLKSYFSKSPDEIQPNRESHQYAFGFQHVNNFGGNSWLGLWNPVGDFSLSQQWYDAGTGSGTQTVEAGWIVYPNKFGTTRPVLFIFFTPDNYASGCYNLDCVGFVQINPDWVLGSPFGPVSIIGGTQREIRIQWKMYNGNWWLYLQGDDSSDAVGYYPGSVYKGGPMASMATSVKYGGEVYRNSAGVNWPQMGSSVLPSGGYGRSAFQHNIFYIDLSSNSVGAGLTRSVIGLTTCWSIDITHAGDSTSWGTSFFYGGPGGQVCTA